MGDEGKHIGSGDEDGMVGRKRRIACGVAAVPGVLQGLAELEDRPAFSGLVEHEVPPGVLAALRAAGSGRLGLGSCPSLSSPGCGIRVRRVDRGPDPTWLDLNLCK